MTDMDAIRSCVSRVLAIGEEVYGEEENSLLRHRLGVVRGRMGSSLQT
jgi:hypothetical protein